jgi:hypothetical protein
MVVISDIDGTLAVRVDRGPFEWHRLLEDKPNDSAIEVLHALHARGHEIIFISGRTEDLRTQTVLWLSRNVGLPGRLLMRKTNDNRRDDTVKAEIFMDLNLRSENVLLVLDDRDRVVKMWREKFGLRCFQVGEGNF